MKPPVHLVSKEFLAMTNPERVTSDETPGRVWLEIVRRPTEEAFAAAFATDVVLDTSIASRPIVGPPGIWHFFEASRTMYDTIRFTHETSMGSRTCLEWEGKFQARDIAGTTIIAFDANGAIKSIQLFHRPYEQVIAYSTELGRRLKGKIDPSIFPGTGT
jgi:hypothetical protein